MAKSRASKKDPDILEITEKAPNYKREEEITEEKASPAAIEDYIFFKDQDKLVKLDLDKIVLLEAMSNYIHVYYFTEHFEFVEIIREEDDDADDQDGNVKKKKKTKDGLVKALRMNTIRQYEKKLLRLTLSEAMQKLPANKFARVNRSYSISLVQLLNFSRHHADFYKMRLNYEPSKYYYDKLLARLKTLSPK